jgi:small GTP-binding protein
MVFFNYATMQMAAKIVYYGPGLCGKTTNLQYIYQKTAPKSRGEMVSLETETDRTLFFDLLPLDVGNIAGFKTRFQLYTVPGQVFYNSTRKLVLRGVDGVVFVADSQSPMLDANIESINNLRDNLEELGLKMEDVPLVLQYNKRDLKTILSVEEMNRALNPHNVPFFEAAALQGVGVFETLKGISKATLITLRKKALGEDKPKIPEAAKADAPKAPTPAPGAPMPTPAPAAANPAVEAKPITTQPPLPTAAEIAKETIEFAQLATLTTKPEVKKIAVKTSDIGSKLDALRDMYTGTKPVTKEKKLITGADQMLSALIETARGSKQKTVSKKLKIRLDPAEIDQIKNLALDFHLTGDSNIHKKFSNAVTAPIEGKGNPKRILLKIELEILKK